MARTASMTATEAETLLGLRGRLVVNSENRATARKWLVACGLSSGHVGGMALREMQAAYNDTSDTVLNRCREKAAEAARELGEAPEGEAQAARVPAMPQAGPDASRIASVIAAVLASLPPSVDPDTVRDLAREIVRDEMAERKPQGVDAAAVLAILRAELPNLIPVTRLEIKIGDETRHLPARVRHVEFADVFTCTSIGHAVCLVGPAGSGKTTLAEQVFEALGVQFYIQGAVSGAHELLGYCDAAGTYHTTPFRQAYEHGGGICLDELDAGDAAAVLVINAALANGHQAFPDQPLPVKRHKDFRLIACANTYGHGADRQYVGRTQLDAATIDRFSFVDCGYDEKLELALAGNDDWVRHVQACRRAAERQKLRLIISPRASIMGAQALAAGMPRDKVESRYLFKGADAETVRRIKAGV